MTTYNAMMAHTFEGDTSKIVGWYASRKFKGWRAIWNGHKLETLGRYSGPKQIFPPKFWQSALPNGVPLDGELWHKSDSEEFVKSVVGQSPIGSFSDERWKEIVYMVYDYKPYQVIGFSQDACKRLQVNELFWLNRPWIERQELLRKSISSFCSYGNHSNNFIKLTNQSYISHVSDYNRLLDYSKQNKWEGLMLSDSSAFYSLKRVYNLLKVKPFFDYEAYVIGYTDGEGKHAGRLGALMCQLVWNEQVIGFKGGHPEHVGQEIVFRVGGGFTDEQRIKYRLLYPIGTKINFTFLNVSESGVPQSANFSTKINSVEGI